MFKHSTPKKSAKPAKQIFPSDVYPSGKVTKKPKETMPQSLMNYDIIRDKVQTQFIPKSAPTSAPNKSNPNKKQLIKTIKYD
jgi:hypothetical protein